MAGKILVLGSSNVDLILKTPRFHDPGETIAAEKMITAFGGKGANQAIAARRLGGKVVFLTKLGNDPYAGDYRDYLVRNGLPSGFLLRDPRLPTGVALIQLGPKAENRIVIAAGANGSLSVADLRRLSAAWEGVSVFVSQLETPLPAVTGGLKIARDRGITTVLNPAPASPFPKDLLRHVDYLVPNAREAETLTGIRMKKEEDLPRIAGKLLRLGAGNVVITLGSRGLFFTNGKEEIRMPAFRVKAVDTTAAGDAFVGGFAVGLSEHRPIHEVLRMASAAGALAATKLGAQPSLPFKKDLEKLLTRRGDSRIAPTPQRQT
ncbi:MAG TPA: ribokinase [Thermodesulfobacteriota bacterium]|nr:ribokinase [Thermodesulfobacteriota bacterium]